MSKQKIIGRDRPYRRDHSVSDCNMNQWGRGCGRRKMKASTDYRKIPNLTADCRFTFPWMPYEGAVWVPSRAGQVLGSGFPDRIREQLIIKPQLMSCPWLRETRRAAASSRWIRSQVFAYAATCRAATGPFWGAGHKGLYLTRPISSVDFQLGICPGLFGWHYFLGSSTHVLSTGLCMRRVIP